MPPGFLALLIRVPGCSLGSGQGVPQRHPPPPFTYSARGSCGSEGLEILPKAGHPCLVPPQEGPRLPGRGLWALAHTLLSLALTPRLHKDPESPMSMGEAENRICELPETRQRGPQRGRAAQAEGRRGPPASRVGQVIGGQCEHVGSAGVVTVTAGAPLLLGLTPGPCWAIATAFIIVISEAMRGGAVAQLSGETPESAVL